MKIAGLILVILLVSLTIVAVKVMSDTKFTLILPSNTPGLANKNNNFRIQLPKTIHFDSNWETALYSIIYPRTWQSLGAEEDQFIKLVDTSFKEFKIPVAKGNYSNVDQLASIITEYMKSLKPREKRFDNLVESITEAREASSLYSENVKSYEKLKVQLQKTQEKTIEMYQKMRVALKDANNAGMNYLPNARELQEILDKRAKEYHDQKAYEKQLTDDFKEFEKDLENERKKVIELQANVEKLQNEEKLQESPRNIRQNGTHHNPEKAVQHNVEKTVQHNVEKTLQHNLEIDSENNQKAIQTNNDLVNEKNIKDLRDEKDQANKAKLDDIKTNLDKTNAENINAAQKALDAENAAGLKKIEAALDAENAAGLKRIEAANDADLKKNAGLDASTESTITPTIESTITPTTESTITPTTAPTTESTITPDMQTEQAVDALDAENAANLEKIRNENDRENRENIDAIEKLKNKMLVLIDKKDENKDEKKQYQELEELNKANLEAIKHHAQLIDKVTNQINENSIFPSYNYPEGNGIVFDKMMHRYRLYLSKPYLYVEFSEQLQYMLGFGQEQMLVHNTIAKYDTDLSGGLNQFCVYIDGLIDNVVVGNKMTNLLRIINVEGEIGKSVEKIFENPIFIPVNVKEINTVHIELRTLSGSFLPMEFGHVIVTLLFRRRGIF